MEMAGRNTVKLGCLVALCVALAAAVSAPAASAWEPGGPPICSELGEPIAGAYHNFTITGNHWVGIESELSVYGNLTIARGACLDAFTLGKVYVSGNIIVEPGAILALGCSPGAVGPGEPCESQTTEDIVGGSIIALHPLTMYLDGDTIDGSVLSYGGGPGATLSPYVNFPIKENDIGGNLLVSGWKGAWFGVLRNTVHRNVILLGDVGVTTSPETGEPDSTEIATNTISGNLVCFGNSPAAQFGDSGGLPNVVGGLAIGQCKKVV
jgi:hypothetical protein